jgi:hypothetical protein
MDLAWFEEEEILELPLAPSDRRYMEFRLDGHGGSKGGTAE